jgi:RNA polymerase sigma-70 factor (ECF subfamily)
VHLSDLYGRLIGACRLFWTSGIERLYSPANPDYDGSGPFRMANVTVITEHALSAPIRRPPTCDSGRSYGVIGGSVIRFLTLLAPDPGVEVRHRCGAARQQRRPAGEAIMLTRLESSDSLIDSGNGYQRLLVAQRSSGRGLGPYRRLHFVTREQHPQQHRTASPGEQVACAPVKQRLNALLPQAVNGDRSAVTVIMSLIDPLVIRYCRARLGRSNGRYVSAVDVAQEVHIGVLTALPRFDYTMGAFLSFVYTIAKHKVIDAQRKSSRDYADPVADLPENSACEDEPAEQYERADLSYRLGCLMGMLTSWQREVLILRVVHGLTSVEAASRTGATPGSVRVTQHRALQRLRTELRTGNHDLQLALAGPTSLSPQIRSGSYE